MHSYTMSELVQPVVAKPVLRGQSKIDRTNA